ncbi:MAG: InlB B-repeat-containing protein [Chitinispirillales bacterium]|jgi:uncharacterized protein (TIGR02145 family)/uncharacterized repeat protein (TIGR02543 family)|nr:InlB B-repeat-containing protein [Chitinispirillales bacterium]
MGGFKRASLNRGKWIFFITVFFCFCIEDRFVTPKVKQFTVTFDANGAAPAPQSSVAVDSGAVFSTVIPDDPQKPDSTFIGWFDDKGKMYTASTIIVRDVTLTAKWIITTYTVTYMANITGAAAPADPHSPYPRGAQVTVLDIDSLERPNYAFDGWNTAANGSGTPYAAKTVFNIYSNIVLHAQWVLSVGEFIDTRDYQVYATVEAGGKKWMGKNLNYAADSSWCYSNDSSNCVKYGRLYNWDSAVQSCPPGWRLPARQEWTDLINAAGGDNIAGTKLKSSLPNWNGDDEFRFSAMPGGCRYPDNTFYHAGDRGFWWTADEFNENSSYRLFMRSDSAEVFEYYYQKNYSYSVRCVKD